MRRGDLIVSLAGAALWTHGVIPERRAMAAGLGFTWTKVPAITVVGAANDRRQALIRDAVAFWNDTGRPRIWLPPRGNYTGPRKCPRCGHRWNEPERAERHEAGVSSRVGVDPR